MIGHGGKEFLSPDLDVSVSFAWVRSRLSKSSQFLFSISACNQRPSGISYIRIVLSCFSKEHAKAVVLPSLVSKKGPDYLGLAIGV